MSIKKPDAIYPNAPLTQPSPLKGFIADPSLKGSSFDELLRNRGIRFFHKKATPCPNVNSLDDNNHDPDCPHCDGSGILFYQEKELIGLFISNSVEKLFEVQGVWEVGTAVCSFPTIYEDGTQADFNTFDQLTCPDFEIRLWELKEFEPSSDNQQRLRYPIANIDSMSSVDAAGNLKFFEKETDFNLVDGNIEWVSGKEPPYDSVNEIGEVLSISYYANPVYNVLQHMHELRVTQQLIDGSPSKQAIRLPQQVLVKRDFLVNSSEKLNT